MIVAVSVSDLRNNISNYLEKVFNGTRVLVCDEKRGIIVPNKKYSSLLRKYGAFIVNIDLFKKKLQKKIKKRGIPAGLNPLVVLS